MFKSVFSRPKHIPAWSFCVLSCLLLVLTNVSYADPITGSVTWANSILGGQKDDLTGKNGVFVLPSGNIVIASSDWDGERGAVTCLTPAEYQLGGITISAKNSLVGKVTGDFVGSGGVTILSNGNYVVSSPSWNNGLTLDVGAVTWVNGETCIPFGESSRAAVVSPSNSLIGISKDDGEKSYVVALTNGNYVVGSPLWDNGAKVNVGAVTWGNGATGTVGVIDVSNSLVGTNAESQVGKNLVALSNGNYVVGSPFWNRGASETSGFGAATWGNGVIGTVGTVSATNSLVGASIGHQVGKHLTALTNGNYVVASPTYYNDGLSGIGAITWGNGATGTVGVVSPSNSLIGAYAGDYLGGAYQKNGIIALSNGNYVVVSPFWNGLRGAVTWGDGSVGTVGVVGAANSLVGSDPGDEIGITDIVFGVHGVVALTNGNYVVPSPLWDNGTIENAGAITWGNGAGGTVGEISAANSLVGTMLNDYIGYGVVSVIPLTNGNYVAISPYWNKGPAYGGGAVTWGDGTSGTVGIISASNSLIGTPGSVPVRSGSTTTFTSGVVALTNGNYVVPSYYWNNGVANVGAVTWGNGATGTVGTVSAANSLVGASEGDMFDSRLFYQSGIFALSNGNYVVSLPFWDNGSIVDVGAVIWGDGASGTIGVISAANALIGSTTGDYVGSGGATPLSDGSYVVRSPSWSNGTVTSVGAATWGNSTGSTVGVVSAINSIVGSTTEDYVSNKGVIGLSDGNYLIVSPSWDNRFKVNVGAVTYSNPLVLPNLLINGDFEMSGTVGWKIQKASGDKRACPINQNNLNSGACAFKFTGSATDAAKLIQVVNLAGYTFAAGDTLTASAFFKGNDKQAKVSMVLNVFYTGVTKPVKTKLTVTRNAEHNRYILPTYTLTSGDVRQINLTFINLSNAGTVWIDDVILSHNGQSASIRAGALLDLPDLPEGFRR